jgi:hypothetical protein
LAAALITTVAVQNAQRRAAAGISLRHSGHCFFAGAAGACERESEFSLFMGATTKK